MLYIEKLYSCIVRNVCSHTIPYRIAITINLNKLGNVLLKMGAYKSTGWGHIVKYWIACQLAKTVRYHVLRNFTVALLARNIITPHSTASIVKLLHWIAFQIARTVSYHGLLLCYIAIIYSGLSLQRLQNLNRLILCYQFKCFTKCINY